MGVRFDNCVKRGESAAERPMRIVHIKNRTASASFLEYGAQIDSRNSFRSEVRQKQIVFGRPACILRPNRQVVRINARGARRGGDQKTDGASSKIFVHPREQIGQL